MAQRAAAQSPAERLAGRLDDPATADPLNELLDHADLVALLVTGLSEFLQRGDTMTDSIADGLRDLKTAATVTAGGDLGGMLRQTGPLLRSLEGALPAMQQLIEPGPDGIGLLDVAAMLGRAATSSAGAAEAPNARGGVLSLVRALRDDDVRRALAFGLAFAKALGGELRTAGAGTATRPA